MIEGQEEMGTDPTPRKEEGGDMMITLTTTLMIIPEKEDIVGGMIVTMTILIMIGEGEEVAEFCREEGEIHHHIIEEEAVHRQATHLDPLRLKKEGTNQTQTKP